MPMAQQFLQIRKDEEAARFGDCYRDIFALSSNFLANKNIQYSIRSFLEPAIYQRIWVSTLLIPQSLSPIDDTISRPATWNALYEDKEMPNIENDAVEKYAGLLDAYLPEDIPVECILKHAKG
jgi:hypothetical protein